MQRGTELQFQMMYVYYRQFEVSGMVSDSKSPSTHAVLGKSDNWLLLCIFEEFKMEHDTLKWKHKHLHSNMGGSIGTFFPVL